MIQTSFNAISTGATGMFARQVVLYVRHGRLIIAKAPRKRPGKGTPGQERTRADFTLATGWSRKVRASAELRSRYQRFVAGGKNVHNLAIADYLVAPEIHEVSVVRGVIHIKATDNFGVDAVRVSIYDAGGELLETGLAAGDDDTWTYKPAGTPTPGCSVVVTARDLPGNECCCEMVLPVEGQAVPPEVMTRSLGRQRAPFRRMAGSG